MNLSVDFPHSTAFVQGTSFGISHWSDFGRLYNLNANAKKQKAPYIDL